MSKQVKKSIIAKAVKIEILMRDLEIIAQRDSEAYCHLDYTKMDEVRANLRLMVKALNV